MNTIVTEVNLEAGINVWRRRKWDDDFHNCLYKKLMQLKSGGLDRNWWHGIVDELSIWKAIRPLPKADIYLRGIDYLGQFQVEYDRILRVTNKHEPEMTTISWETLSSLYTVASSIKNVSSPVFGSKLCHFLLPNAFPVIDNEAIGLNRTYADYWDYCKTQWVNCGEKQELINNLRQKIQEKVQGKVVEYYPWSTKLTELCIIGNKLLT